ncbi:MAG TPA: NIPSNAP family protein [Chitinophagaceae bacterium]|nr:NIPSNAP family protein [Chitinophagaceae bacterium]
MRRICSTIAVLLLMLSGQLTNAQQARESYQLTVYHFNSPEQEKAIDGYLKSAYIPAVRKNGIKDVGVFKLIANDTATDKRIYVLIPLKKIEDISTLSPAQLVDQQNLQNGKDYLDAPFSNVPYLRIENIVLKAFELAPKMSLPKLSAAKTDRIYELRSYEGGTEKLFRNKVEMFNQGGEIKLFERLNFNAVFYAEVLSGSRMPNLMYMTSFESREDRDAHWKTFGNDPEWKKLSALPQYQKNVSKIDIMLLTAAEYSDY